VNVRDKTLDSLELKFDSTIGHFKNKTKDSRVSNIISLEKMYKARVDSV